MVFIIFILFGFTAIFLIYGLMSFISFGKFLTIISSNILLPDSLSADGIQVLGPFTMFHVSLTLVHIFSIWFPPHSRMDISTHLLHSSLIPLFICVLLAVIFIYSALNFGCTVFSFLKFPFGDFLYRFLFSVKFFILLSIFLKN